MVMLANTEQLELLFITGESMMLRKLAVSSKAKHTCAHEQENFMYSTTRYLLECSQQHSETHQKSPNAHQEQSRKIHDSIIHREIIYDSEDESCTNYLLIIQKNVMNIVLNEMSKTQMSTYCYSIYFNKNRYL